VDFKKYLRPGSLLLVLPFVLLIVFVVLFLDTCSEYGRVREFRTQTRQNPFAIHDLNKYRKQLAGRTQMLEKLRRSVSITFRPSELKDKVEAMAALSAIPVNNVSIERFRVRESGRLQRVLLEVRVKTTFPRLGAFVSRLEKLTVREQDRFEYVLQVQRLDIAVLNLYESTLSARLHLAVFRKGGS
jgi:hypothetical protein